MKNKIKKILKYFIFLLLLIFSIYKCSTILEYKESKIKYDNFFESDTNYDVIFFGTSAMYNTILPQELWKEYGISSYNWGYLNTTPAINYYLIEEVLKYTSPKLLVFDLYGLVEYETYNNSKYRGDEKEQQHIQFDILPLSKNKIKAINDIFDDYPYNEEFIWNFISYHNRWNELNEKDFNYKPTKQKGAYYLTEIGSNDSFELISKTETVEINSVCYKYFIKILEYCEKKDIDLLLTYIPIPVREESQKVANSISKIIKDYDNVRYVNMLREDIVDYNVDLHKDGIHLNFSAAMKTTRWLGNYIKENYNLDDYSNSESWKNGYKDYLKYKIYKIKIQETLQNVLLLLKDPNYDVLIEIKNHKILNDTLNLNLLKNLGVNGEKLKSNIDFLFIENGGEKANYIEETKKENISLDGNVITLQKKDNDYNIYLNDKEIKNEEISGNNMRIIIFDNETHEFLADIAY